MATKFNITVVTSEIKEENSEFEFENSRDTDKEPGYYLFVCFPNGQGDWIGPFLTSGDARDFETGLARDPNIKKWSSGIFFSDKPSSPAFRC